MSEITLVRAQIGDAQRIHEMKYRAFLPLFQKYRDEQTSPAVEKIDKVIRQLQSDNTDYYLIERYGEVAGAIRAVRDGMVDGYETMRISPLFVLPEFQGMGVGYRTMMLAMSMYPQTEIWRLSTIKEEKGNCRLYEKCGFVPTGENSVNERMTLVFYERKGACI